jgi:hypothetical protein
MPLLVDGPSPLATSLTPLASWVSLPTVLDAATRGQDARRPSTARRHGGRLLATNEGYGGAPLQCLYYRSLARIFPMRPG